jgi:hypothetical protein
MLVFMITVSAPILREKEEVSYPGVKKLERIDQTIEVIQANLDKGRHKGPRGIILAKQVNRVTD